MDPVTISLIVQYAIKFGIPAAEAIVELFHKQEVSLDDWRKAFAPAKKSYADYEAIQPGSGIQELPLK